MSVESELQEPYERGNERLAEQFIEDLPPMSKKRVAKHRTILRNVSNWWLRKPFEQATKQDLKAIYSVVMKWDNREYGPYEPWTKSDYLRVVKRFFKWQVGAELANVIRIPQPEETVGPDDILTEVELNMIYGVCHNLRDKAMSVTEYEGALRPHELLGLRKADVLFDDFGAIIYVRRGKTGPRRVRVASAAITGFYKSNDAQLFGDYQTANQASKVPPKALYPEDIRKVLKAIASEDANPPPDSLAKRDRD